MVFADTEWSIEKKELGHQAQMKFKHKDFDQIQPNEIANEFLSEDDGVAIFLVSKREVDDQMKSLMNDFVGDADKKSIDKAPEEVLKYCRTSDAKPFWPIATGQILLEIIWETRRVTCGPSIKVCQTSA
ncbi:unnamed protein product [Arabis nemorensis]|uniref:Uncharacterized protein n=1 Tax=Arabis nemorensis TaxID=586526 RepID=A0A565AZV4_9BRAS|nr:unnamed protein product [Arabis nemorensis]